MLPSLSEMNETKCDGPIPADHVTTRRVFNSYHGGRPSYGNQGRPDNLNLTSFPILKSADQKHPSSLETHVSDDLWLSSNVNDLIKGFSIVNEPNTPLVTERSA